MGRVVSTLFLLGTLRSRLVKLNVSVTSICNSRCRSCDIWKEPKRSAQTDLTASQFEKIFADTPKTLCWLSITGGEPFLREDLGEILESSLKHLPRLRLLSITTNGLDRIRPPEILGRLLKDHPQLRIYLNISLDGMALTHDRLRGINGNFVSALALRESMRKVQMRFGSQLKVTFESTVLRENREELDRVSELAAHNQTLHMLTIGRESGFYRHKAAATPPLFLAPAEAIDYLKGYLAKMRLVVGFDHVIRRALYFGSIQFLQTRRHPVRCVAARTSLVVGAKGSVSPCIHWSKNLGDLSKGNTLREIAIAPETQATAREIRAEKCPGCWTPCEATQSLLASPLKCLYFALKTLGERKGKYPIQGQIRPAVRSLPVPAE